MNVNDGGVEVDHSPRCRQDLDVEAMDQHRAVRGGTTLVFGEEVELDSNDQLRHQPLQDHLTVW